jgi:hypothetical protein
MSDTRSRLLIIAGVVAACCAASYAQTFYKWTDERGVIHFADEPPPNTRAEERTLPVLPPERPAPLAGDSEEATAASEDAPTRKSQAGNGAAQIIMVSRQVIRNGPHAVHVIGEVKNVGGQDAGAVGVTLSAADAIQGNPCLNEQAAVSPSTLPPGQTGNFDVDLDSPCLAGDAPVDVAPVWK